MPAVGIRRLHLVLVVAGLVASCSPGVQPGAFLQGSFDVPDGLVSRDVPAETLRYVIRFPEGWESGDDVPLVVFLHGSGDSDYDSEWLTSYGLPAAVLFDDAVAAREFVLLAPQATPGTGWWWGRQSETVMALVDEVIQTHRLDESEVLLTGLSMGGYGSWHLATRFPDRFTRVASVSGSGYGSTDLPDDLDVCALAATELRVYHGAEDLISLLDLNIGVIEAWEARCGATIQTEILPGLGHFSTFESVYTDAAFYDWFLGSA